MARRWPSSAVGRYAVATVAALFAVTLVGQVASQAVVAPSVFRPGVSATVLVLVGGSGAEGSYQARLEQQGCEADCESALVVNSENATGGAVQLEMEVPEAHTPGTYSLTVTKGGEVLQEQEVEVLDEGPQLLLETDKPVYKPGAEVKARVLCLLPSFQPCTDVPQVRLILKNPDGNKVFAVMGNNSANAGVFEGSLLVDARAPLGEYTVVAEAGAAGAAEVVVSVDEYVLPKFEVTVRADQEYLSPATQELTGTVTAVYSYGEGVAGTAALALRKESYGWMCHQSNAGGDELELELEDVAMADAAPGRPANGGFLPSEPPNSGDCGAVVAASPPAALEGGELAFRIPRPNGLDTWGTLTLEVSVTEEATGAVVNASTTVQLRGEVYPSVRVEAPEVYFPGLDIPLEVTSEWSDGSPDDGRFTVELEFRPYGWEVTAVRAETRSAEVEVVGGKGSLRIAAPPQPDCCTAAVADLDNFQWGKNSCCWSTVSPRVYRVGGEEQGAQGWGNCIEPAFPPSAEYITIESAATDAADATSIRVAVSATSALSGRDVFYLVTADGSYVTSGAVSWATPLSAEDRAGEFLVPKSLAMLPVAHLVVAYLNTEGSLTAGDKTVTLDGAEELRMLASREVTLSVSQQGSRDYFEPGDEVSITASAEPQSVVFLGAVDRSVSFISEEDTRVTPARLMAMLKQHTYTPPAPEVPSPCAAVRAIAAAGLSLVLPPSHPDHHFCLDLDEARLAQLASGPTCGYYYGGRGDFEEMEMMPVMDAVDGGAAENQRNPVAAAPENAVAQSSTRVRTSFPETWIWRSAVASADGTAAFLAAAPDSITTWDLSAFSIGAAAGLGLQLGAASEVRVFKPLFVQIKLPYKVVRGEGLVVVLSAFNYLDQAQTVTMELSSDGGVDIPTSDAARVLQVAPNSAASYQVTLFFSELGVAKLKLEGQAESGEADAVERSLKVVPEGFRKQRTVNLMLQPSEELAGVQSAELSLAVDDPEAVEGSGYASLSLSGDLMGPSLDGLDSLVQLPMGCGEQNMLLMAPNVYVLRYLSAKADSRPTLRETALRFIQIGYSRELEYRHDDGSFSAFGKSDDSGSTWLTAFVLKVFAQAQASGLVEVDEESVAWPAAMWLAALQDRTGKFRSVGRVIHSEMVGGVDDDSDSLSLTAFVVDALLEARDAGLLPSDFPANTITDSLSLLSSTLSAGKEMKNYGVVVTAHALAGAQAQGFSSSGFDLSAAVDAAMERLAAIAIESDGTRHWAPNSTAADGGSGTAEVVALCRGCHQASAAGPEVEMTGYALSTLLLRSGGSSAGIADAFPVVRWLLSERSPNGGWRSTQDTTVALEGLASFASLVSTDPAVMTVTVTYTDGAARRRLRQASTTVLTIDAANRDILQRIELPVDTTVTVTAEGSGMAVMGVNTVWNTKAAPPTEAFKVTGRAMSRSQDDMTMVTQEMSVSRVSGASTGMVIAKVTALSGYVPTAESMAAMKGGCRGAVKRVDYENDEISVYLDKLEPGAAACALRLDMTQESVVENLQAAPMEVYSYYNPEEERGVGEISAEMQAFVPAGAEEDGPTATPNPESPSSSAVRLPRDTLSRALMAVLALAAAALVV